MRFRLLELFLCILVMTLSGLGAWVCLNERHDFHSWMSANLGRRCCLRLPGILLTFCSHGALIYLLFGALASFFGVESDKKDERKK